MCRKGGTVKILPPCGISPLVRGQVGVKMEVVLEGMGLDLGIW